MTQNSSYYKNWPDFFLGRKTNPSDPQSNWRRYHNRICQGVTIVLLGEALYAMLSGGNGIDVNIWTAIFLSANAFWFFYWVVILPPFRNGASVDPARLLFDTVVSTIYMIAVFSLWYRIFGIAPEHSALDTLYFSAVTFSTLGYGDFKPMPSAQAFAAIQAILGNLHLGMIVGATFAATQKNSVKARTG